MISNNELKKFTQRQRNSKHGWQTNHCITRRANTLKMTNHPVGDETDDHE